MIRFDGSKSYDPDEGEDKLNDYIAHYRWTFEDGTSAEGRMASKSYEVQGKYTVTLTVTDSFGKSNSVTVIITVRAESDNTLLYFLVIIGIIVILILLFFPKGSSKPASARIETKEVLEDRGEEMEPEGDGIEGGSVKTDLDDIIDELEEVRVK